MMHTALQSSKKKIDARELFLASDKVRVRIENSGTCSNIFSTDEKRIIFGQSSLLLFKVKAGITIQLRPIFSFIDTEPSNATMESLIDESILIRQKVRITKSGAFLRSVSLRNSSANLLSVKLIFFLDPC